MWYFFIRWPAVCIHGDKSQNERDWVLQGNVQSEHIYYLMMI